MDKPSSLVEKPIATSKFNLTTVSFLWAGPVHEGMTSGVCRMRVEGLFDINGLSSLCFFTFRPYVQLGWHLIPT